MRNEQSLEDTIEKEGDSGLESTPHHYVLHNKDKIMDKFREILLLSGFNPSSNPLRRTPERQWEVLRTMTEGYVIDPTLDRMYRDYALGDLPGVRICPGIHFVSLCEHHFVPFYGVVDIAYVPGNGKVTGLSKLPQLVQKYARRPQLQEKMAAQIADELMQRCEVSGVMVIASGYHTCEMIEGVKEGFHRDKPYITPEIRGSFTADTGLREATMMHLGRLAKNV
jgi:GTP cyclohydrolase I